MKEKTRSLKIKWQRLLVNNETCERCSSTEEEVKKAYQELKQTLPQLGIDIELEKEELTKEEFEKNPKASNRIFINGKPIEELIGAQVGGSECCDVCGDNECRTIEINGETYEVIPAQTIIDSAIKASSELLTEEDCCSPKGTSCC